MRLLIVFVFAFFTVGLSCQVTYSADDKYVDAKEYNIITGSRYYKDVSKVDVTSKGKSNKGNTISVNDTTINLGEKEIDGKLYLVAKSESTLLLGDAKPMVITSYSFYDLEGNFEYSYSKELGMKRVAYDKETFSDKLLLDKKYYSSNKNTDGSIELTEIIASHSNSNIVIKSKSYMINNDIKTISYEAEYVLQKNGAVKQINQKLAYPNEDFELISTKISIVTQNKR